MAVLLVLGASGLAGRVASATVRTAHSAPDCPVPGSSVQAPGYQVKKLVQQNPLPASNGLALDGQGRIFVAHAFFNSISRVDPVTHQVVSIANGSQPVADQVQTPDDLAFGPDGNLYVASVFSKSILRVSPNGGTPVTVGSGITDGNTGPNGIAFRGNRLFVSDLEFVPGSKGSIWEVDPAGAKPPVQVARDLEVPEGFDFASNGLAYVPEMYAERIAVVNVDTGQVSRLGVSFDSPILSIKVVPRNIDPTEPLIVLESGTGKVWKVSRTSGSKTLLAQGEPGLDNLQITNSGTIYVSNFVRGNVRQVDPRTKKLIPLLQDSPLSAPVSLNPTSDGGFVAGDLTSVVKIHPDGGVDRVSRFALDDDQMITSGALQIGRDIYLTDWLSGGKISKLNLDTGARSTVADGFVAPWHLRQGPNGTLLVGDQGLGEVLSVPTDGSGSPTPLLTGLGSVGGLAFDASRGAVYASESDNGPVVSVPVSGGTPTVVATGLSTPEGIAVRPDGSLLVAEAATGCVTRIDPSSGAKTTVATGFKMDIRGISLLPFVNYTADVAALGNGNIVVSNPADGSITTLIPR
jgi:streptogramin lyase